MVKLKFKSTEGISTSTMIKILQDTDTNTEYNITQNNKTERPRKIKRKKALNIIVPLTE